MAVRDLPAVSPGDSPSLVFGRYSTLFALSVLLWILSSGTLVLRVLAVLPQLVGIVRAYAGVWIALQEVDVDEPATLVEPCWLSVAVAVTIGASTASLHVLLLRSPMLLAATVAVLLVVFEEWFGIQEFGTASEVARLRALFDDEDEHGECGEK